MKKYITIAALLAAGSAFANAELVSTTGTDDFSGTGYSAITGFCADLDLLTWSPDIVKTGTIALDSITFNSTSGANDASKFYSGSLYAFIYEGEVAANNASGDAVAISRNAIEWNSKVDANSGTWTFSNVSLDLTKTYSVLFSSTADSFTSAKGSSEGIRSTVTTSAVATKASNYNGSAFSVDGVENGVDVTFSGTATAIPEPSAFGLLAGLGALALVGARRRR